jgi:thiamine biosynthesis lipoprotein
MPQLARAPDSATVGAAASPGASASAQPSAAATAFIPEKVTGEDHAMGTHLAYAAFTTPALDAAKIRALFGAASDEIRRVEKLMTTWDPSSEVSRINEAAGKQPVAVGQETFDVVHEALHASEISDGCMACGSSIRTSIRTRPRKAPSGRSSRTWAGST